MEEFAKMKSGDVFLRASEGDGNERTIRLGFVMIREEAQRAQLDRLGLPLHQGLRWIAEVEQM